jgi:hypothetical protein
MIWMTYTSTHLGSKEYEKGGHLDGVEIVDNLEEGPLGLVLREFFAFHETLNHLRGDSEGFI